MDSEHALSNRNCIGILQVKKKKKDNDVILVSISLYNEIINLEMHI